MQLNGLLIKIPFRNFLVADAMSGSRLLLTLRGHPAITVPAGFNPQGLPVGAQFIAAKGAEDTLFSIAYELEDELKWSRHWAPISVAYAGS